MNWPRYIRPLRIVLAVAAAQALVVLAYLWIEYARQDAKEPAFRYEHLAGKKGRDLVLVRPDGSRRRLAESRRRPVLLHFWATWCPPCKKELPGLLALGRELARDRGVETIAVTLDKDWDAVGRFFDGAIPPEVMRDGEGSAADHYELSTLPETYLLGTDGSLRLRFAGARDWQTRFARDALWMETKRSQDE